MINENSVGVSAIVISYNGIGFIPACFLSLKKELAGRDHEIIVVDNHSTDGTIEYIQKEYPEVTIIANHQNYGFAKAVNQGIAASKKEYIWILNQDVRIRQGCINALLACLLVIEKPGVIGPRFVGFDGRLQRSCRRFPRYRYMAAELTGLARLLPRSGTFNGWKMGDFNHQFSRVVEQPMGAAMLISKKCINTVGPMDESFGIFLNDVDFCQRVRNAGYTNYYCAEAVIEHYRGASVELEKPKMVWLWHSSMFRYFLKREKARPGGSIRWWWMTTAWLMGFVLIAAAIPRSIFHCIKQVFYYSYRNASIGFSDAALRAGYQPKKMPMAAEKENPSRIEKNDTVTGQP
jgi:GT2 family glycosyltransferase